MYATGRLHRLARRSLASWRRGVGVLTGSAAVMFCDRVGLALQGPYLVRTVLIHCPSFQLLAVRGYIGDKRIGQGFQSGSRWAHTCNHKIWTVLPSPAGDSGRHKSCC